MSCGVTARVARDLLVGGCVSVDGERCTDVGSLVVAGSRVTVLQQSQSHQVEEVDAPHPREYYLKLFKPRGVICSHLSEKLSTKPIVSALYPQGAQDVLHYCGRLDGDSEGLLLLTSDGLFSFFVTSPEVHLDKEYLAVTNCARDRAPPPPETLQRLRDGIDVGEGGEARAKVAEVVEFDGRFARLRLVVTEGRFRLVRRMLRAIGYSCLQLLRTRVGEVAGVSLRPPTLAEAAAEAWDKKSPAPAAAPATLGDAGALRPGEYAALEPQEVRSLYQNGIRWLERSHAA